MVWPPGCAPGHGPLSDGRPLAILPISLHLNPVGANTASTARVASQIRRPPLIGQVETRMAHDVFISYATANKTSADTTCARLESRGIRCWIAPRDTPLGVPSWRESVLNAVREARVLVVLLSSQTMLSKDVEVEVSTAIKASVPVMPLRIEDVQLQGGLDYLISNIHWLDAVSPPLENHIDRLAGSIERLLDREPGTPRSPVARAEQVAPPNRSRLGLMLGASALVLAGAGAAWFWPRASTSESTPSLASPAASATDTTKETVPARVPSTEPKSVAKQPATPAATTARPVATASTDAIVGCWRWFNGVKINLRDDGSVTGTPFAATWKAVGPSRYSVHWPAPEAALLLSEDGRTLSGVDNYNNRILATRPADAPMTPERLTGVWTWNGATTVAMDDGTVTSGPFRGLWRFAGGRSFKVSWPDNAPIETLTLSNSETLAGTNQYGAKVGGTRASCD